MTRRLVLATLVAGVLAGGTTTAFAGSTHSTPGSTVNEVKYLCVVVFNDPNKPERDGLCVNTPNLPF